MVAMYRSWGLIGRGLPTGGNGNLPNHLHCTGSDVGTLGPCRPASSSTCLCHQECTCATKSTPAPPRVHQECTYATRSTPAPPRVHQECTYATKSTPAPPRVHLRHQECTYATKSAPTPPRVHLRHQECTCSNRATNRGCAYTSAERANALNEKRISQAMTQPARRH